MIQTMQQLFKLMKKLRKGKKLKKLFCAMYKIKKIYVRNHVKLMPVINSRRGFSKGTGEHITDTYITETDTTELENLSHNIIDIFIFEA